MIVFEIHYYICKHHVKAECFEPFETYDELIEYIDQKTDFGHYTKVIAKEFSHPEKQYIAKYNCNELLSDKTLPPAERMIYEGDKLLYYEQFSLIR